LSEDIDAFYAEHTAGGPTHVVATIAVRKDGSSDFAVFSTLDKARAWSASLSEETYEHCVHSPYIVDVPEYGNVPKGQRQ
jgi:hypothetical protein